MRHPTSDREAVSFYLGTLTKRGSPPGTIYHRRSALTRFCEWCRIRRVSLGKITLARLEDYRAYAVTSRGCKPVTANSDMYIARHFVRTLIEEGRLQGSRVSDLYRHSHIRVTLPEEAIVFLETTRESHRPSVTLKFGHAVHLFHSWCEEENVEFGKVSKDTMMKFADFIGSRAYAARQLRDVQIRIRIYLDHLRDRGLFKVDVTELFQFEKPQYRHFVLPGTATEHLSDLETYLRPKTVKSYRSDLTRFHRYLSLKNLTLQKFSRIHATPWLRSLFDDELAPTTRLKILITVKLYLATLAERGMYPHNVDDVIRVRDLPKVPKFLPKPIPPDIDQEIQRQLRESTDIIHKGLLLLRLTGMRIGELSAMPFDCVAKDEVGRSFLKVPLGKMYNERWVPLDAVAIDTIAVIQRTGEAGRDLLLLGASPELNLNHLYKAFKKLTAHFKSPDSLHPHRLRHTYATTLLNAGVDLVSLMRLMGHKDLKTTLRYAAVTQLTLHRVYFKALHEIETTAGFELPSVVTGTSPSSPERAIEDVIRLLRNLDHNASPSADRKMKLLEKRLQRMKTEIVALQK